TQRVDQITVFSRHLCPLAKRSDAAQTKQAVSCHLQLTGAGDCRLRRLSTAETPLADHHTVRIHPGQSFHNQWKSRSCCYFRRWQIHCPWIERGRAPEPARPPGAPTAPYPLPPP